MTTDERIEQRRAHLHQQLAAIPPDDQLLSSATRADLLRGQQQRADLERKLATLNAAVAAVQALGSVEDDEQWRAHLTEWREVLVAERMEIKSPIRDPKMKGLERNLALSIKTIDRGLNVLDQTGYDLATCRLGELMLASGFTIADADPSKNYIGRLPWFGSLSEVEKRIATLATKREQAEANLEAALMTDEEREQQEQESKQLRDAFNSMNVRVGSDANEPCLVTSLSLDEMSPLQRRAFEAADAAFRATYRRAEPVTS